MSHESIPLILYGLGFILALALVIIHWLEQGEDSNPKMPRADKPAIDRLHPSL